MLNHKSSPVSVFACPKTGPKRVNGFTRPCLCLWWPKLRRRMFKVCTARGAWFASSPGLPDPNKMFLEKMYVLSLIGTALLFCLTHHHVGLAKHRKFPKPYACTKNDFFVIMVLMPPRTIAAALNHRSRSDHREVRDCTFAQPIILACGTCASAAIAVVWSACG